MILPNVKEATSKTVFTLEVSGEVLQERFGRHCASWNEVLLCILNGVSEQNAFTSLGWEGLGYEGIGLGKPLRKGKRGRDD